MKRVGFLAMVALALWSGPVRALEVEVAAPGDTLSGDLAPTTAGGDTLVAAFRLSGVFDGDDSLGEGVPATLFLVVDLWRERSGWWDSLVRSQVYTYRFRRDVWSGAYELTVMERATFGLANRDQLLGYLEEVHEVVLGTPDQFEPDHGYYLTVKALLRPLELDDLEEIDAWLSGRVTGTSGEGGILGVPKTLARLVIDASGFGDQSVVGRSDRFIPRP